MTRAATSRPWQGERIPPKTSELDLVARNFTSLEAQLRGDPSLPLYYADRLVSAAYTIQATDCLILADTTSGALPLTLPRAATIRGRRFDLAKVNAGANNIVLTAAAGELIDGAPTLTWNTQWLSYTIQSCFFSATVAGWKVV